MKYDMEINMHRGDLQEIEFEVIDGDSEPIEGITEIFWTVKRSVHDKNFVIQKKLSDNTIQSVDATYYFTIRPEDTDGLAFGEYPFDIEVIGEGLKKTFLGLLNLEKEVTYSSNEGDG